MKAHCQLQAHAWRQDPDDLVLLKQPKQNKDGTCLQPMALSSCKAKSLLATFNVTCTSCNTATPPGATTALIKPPRARGRPG